MGGLPCMNGKASCRRGNDDATMALRCAPSSPDTLSCCRVSEYRGEVVRVVDGDTFEVLHNQCPERIRLSGIDCPEKGQAYGTRAKQAMSAMVLGKKSRLRLTASTSTSAPLLMCSCRNVNHSLVKDGWR